MRHEQPKIIDVARGKIRTRDHRRGGDQAIELEPPRTACTIEQIRRADRVDLLEIREAGGEKFARRGDLRG